MVRQLTPEWWAEISHELQAHVREEEQFLRAYRELAAGINDPGVRLLVELIVEDEERHHALMARIAAAARGDAGGDATAAPEFSTDDVERLLAPTERFLDAEREDRRRLRDLSRALRPLRDDNLWPLIVEAMEIDTRKHVRILEYLRQRMRAAT
jgi:rubrerythrin